MKVRYALLATAALLTPAFAADSATDTLAGEPALSAKRLSGSITAGYSTNYTGRGYVISHAVAEGDSAEFFALKLSYDVGSKSYWSFDSTIAYTTVSSGHVLYGNPTFGPNVATMLGMQAWLQAGAPAGMQEAFIEGAKQRHVKEANIENEFAVMTAAQYTREQWNVAFGHDFVHGGLLGVMAKHYRAQGASCVNEVFVTPTWTPAPWFEMGVTTRYSFQGITGWWFEPQATFKAPIIGTPEDVKLAGVLTFAMTATADYFQSRYFACKNGSQAFWIKFSTPYFVNNEKSLIITPSVSFNWAGKGAMKANENSEFKKYTENIKNVPFRNFGVVGSVSCTYKF